MKIADLVVNNRTTIALMLTDLTLKQTSTKKDYLDLVLTDGSDDIVAKVWNWNKAHALPVKGVVYVITGTSSEYKGAKQLSVASLVKQEPQNIEAFVKRYVPGSKQPSSPSVFTSKIVDEKIRFFVEAIFTDLKEPFMLATGAKSIHHAGIGGLAAHTFEVCSIAMAMAECYKDDVCLDLIIAGALLHDIGKIFTYDIESASIEMADAGLLFEHIVIGNDVIQKKAAVLGEKYDKIAEYLSHIILSHHGQIEYGSPITPKFLEAYIIAMADKLSADAAVLLQANKKAISIGATKTDRLYTLNNSVHLLQKTVREVVNNG